MKTYTFLAALISLAAIGSGHATAEVVVDFEDLSLSPNSYYNGAPGSGSEPGGWTSGGVFFSNSYDPTWGAWNGWAYSNVNNPDTGGFGNQYAAITGTGVGGSGNYAIATGSSRTYFDLPTGTRLQSAQVTNTSYTAWDMVTGSQFSRPFAAGDFFTATFTGYSETGATGTQTGAVHVSLADFAGYTDGDDRFDYILTDWLQVDFTPLGSAKSVAVSFASSDVGQWGMNTPAYLAVDNLGVTAVPEPSAFVAIGVLALAGTWRYRRRSKQQLQARPAAQVDG